MRKFTCLVTRGFTLFIFFLSYVNANAQPAPKLVDFAVWGGSSVATPYNNMQNVLLGNYVVINGKVGSNHIVEGKNFVTINGNIHSGNVISLAPDSKLTGNLFAENKSGITGDVIIGANKIQFTGNLTAAGKITLSTGGGTGASTISGTVSVPAPTNNNYSGPTPNGGINNVVSLSGLPIMPNNTAFDNNIGTTQIANTTKISPGSFLKMALTGNKTLTFDGPGNYIFYEVKNGGSNKFVFDFKNTAAGTINIFVIKDALWGKLSVKTANGNFPNRIYTEIHGDGAMNNGFSFDLLVDDPLPNNSFAWLGNVWAPNGGISVKNVKKPGNTTHIKGALWSGIKVDIRENIRVVYEAPVAEPIFIDPYYPPPPTGKVDEANNIIGAELLSLFQNETTIAEIPENEIYRFNEDKTMVMIEVISKAPNDGALKLALGVLGMTDFIDNGPHIYTITGFFPIDKLLDIQDLQGVEYVRPLYPPLNNKGATTTQGDTTQRSYQVRDRFGLDGEGVKIGVLSDSYNKVNGGIDAPQNVIEGDLPGLAGSDFPDAVQVLLDFPFGGHDEGRAMLQIIHDIAPKAKLAFRTGFLSAGDFANGILQMGNTGNPSEYCDVIVDDITYPIEPFLRDGIVAQAVNQVVNQGVTYFSSAGNFGDRSHETNFNGVLRPALIPSPGLVHKFGPNPEDISQTINLKPGSYTIVLQWDEDFHSVAGITTQEKVDLDLYILGTSGFPLFGFNRSNLFGDPFEVCPFRVTEETNAQIIIVSAKGATNIRFKYIIFRGNATIDNHKQPNPSTIVGHPNAAGAIAVGAMLYDNFPEFTPVWPGVASFSSRGGTQTKVGGSFITRNKPELVGPNGVNTTVNLGGAVFNDGDLYPNFFGTSAAAPHAAAVAGLLIQGRKKYNLQTTVTPGEIRQQLQTSAGKFPNLSVNHNFVGGYGYLQADSAIEQIANARPIIDLLEAVTPGAQNGTEPFMVKVSGKYLTPDTKIYYYGKPMETTVSADKTEAYATVPPIPNGDDPPFQLYNPPKSESELDGGLSEALHFFSSVVDVTIRAENKTRKYGQSNPVLTAEILVNGVPLEQTSLTLEELKLDNLEFTTVALPASRPGLYGIFPSRAIPLENDDPLHTQYGFTFVSGTLLIEKMPLKITPQNKIVKYGEGIGEIDYSYILNNNVEASADLKDGIDALYKKYLADNALIVINGLSNVTTNISTQDLSGMSSMASFQAIRNARTYLLQNGRFIPMGENIDPSQIGEQRFLIDVAANSIVNYLLDSAQSAMVYANGEGNARAFLNIKALAAGNAQASIPNGQLQPMVNGQLMAMVNGQLQAIVNGQLQALVNGTYVAADDIVFQNGQLLALVNGEWLAITNGQLQAIVNGELVTVDLSITNGQLQAIVNGEEMQLVNGQLQALVNGQLLAIVNGQLQALVNGQLMPLVNGQLVAFVNGQLQPMVNGQLLAMVNGQLMALVNGELQIIQDLTISNGQLQAIVNGQLQAIVNGQLKAMVNGEVTDIANADVTAELNGQLQAIVNGQLQALVNGQLQALVNGQLQPLVNGDAIAAESVRQLANGQLQALVNGTYIPIANGQLQALVNGQLLAMVNGQLMVAEDGKVNFAVFINGQLQAMVNGQLQAIVNGQLQAMVNGQLQNVESTAIVNGQLQAIVNGQTWTYANGQLLAIVNGQLQPLVNSFDVSGNTDNSKTLVLVDEDDINLQAGSIGGMFPVNMITSLDAGTQTLVPGAFLSDNYEVTYGLGEVEILPALLIAKADSTTKQYGDDNPDFTISYFDFVYDDNEENINQPLATTTADNTSGVGNYPVNLRGGDAQNYTLLLQEGNLEITPQILIVTADNQTWITGQPMPELTISYEGFVNNDNENDVCIPYIIPPSPVTLNQLERATTYSNVLINNESNVYQAQPGEALHLTGSWYQIFIDPNNPYCPGCITQNYIGMLGGDGVVLFTDCYDVSGLGDHSGIIDKQFTAPTTPGVYYITQVSSWEFACYDGVSGNPGNDPFNAFAVVVVNISNETITASTTANENSANGNYPITLQGCNIYNPNYEVTLVEGTLFKGNVLVDGGGASSNQQAVDEAIILKADKLYPNPTHGMLRLEVQQDLASSNNIQVFDVVGKQYAIMPKKINKGIYEIDVSDLSKGMYMMRIKHADKISTFRFIKR